MSTPSYNFDARDADVILRAPLQPGSDEFKDFHVHKTILSIASVLFLDMFSLPQPPQPITGDITIPVIQITESAEVFQVFLRLIYPVGPPAITSLQLVDDLFQIAEKYMANSVHAKLKQTLVSFLKDDPIWVYAIACRANLDAEAELAIPLTFEINLVKDISHTHLRKMTAETYNRLLTSHATRRAALISAVKQSKNVPFNPNGGCSCGDWFYTALHKDICLAIWEKPFLDRRRLDLCLLDSTRKESGCGGGLCRVSGRGISCYFTNVLNEIRKLG